ncbi:hypothetical protein WME98_24335 [Sorangium sp. So ce296]|uniref:hypothetical protein n=1 Tax=Sorangium sp. So ce296 TaxID=3133296 RepID=UPI003F61A310
MSSMLLDTTDAAVLQFYASNGGAQNGYAALDTSVTDRGVLFTSAEGLRSFAYDRGHLERMFASAGYALARAFAIGPIAAGYMFRPRDFRAPTDVRGER